VKLPFVLLFWEAFGGRRRHKSSPSAPTTTHKNARLQLCRSTPTRVTCAVKSSTARATSPCTPEFIPGTSPMGVMCVARGSPRKAASPCTQQQPKHALCATHWRKPAWLPRLWQALWHKTRPHQASESKDTLHTQGSSRQQHKQHCANKKTMK